MDGTGIRRPGPAVLPLRRKPNPSCTVAAMLLVPIILGAVAGFEDGVGEGAVAIVLDELPGVVEELEEVLEDGDDLLLGAAQRLHGVEGAACPLPRPLGIHPSPTEKPYSGG